MIAHHVGLRERKRMRTMAALQEAALRLFAEQGYDATTVEQIAEAADVSPATFFRYFPSKQALLHTDEFDDMLERVLLDRPADESLFDALRAAMRALRPELEETGSSMLGRIRLLATHPRLRAQLWDAQQANAANLARVIGRRAGRDPADFEVRALASAVIAALMQAVFDWAEPGGTADLDELADLYERALAALERPASVLSSGPRGS